MSSGPVATPGSSAGWPAIQSSKAGQRSWCTDGDDRVHLRELVLDGLDVAEELRPDHDDLGAGILDDLQHLGRGQPPVHRDADGPELGQSEGDFEEFGAVLLDERDPVTGSDAGGRNALAAWLERASSSAKVMVRSPTTQRDGVGTLRRRARERCRRRLAMSAVGMAHLNTAGVQGWTRLSLHDRVDRNSGATVSNARAVTAIRGAMRTGRVRAAVTIQSAASAAVSAGRPVVGPGGRDHRCGDQRVVQRRRMHALVGPLGFDDPADRRQRRLGCVVDARTAARIRSARPRSRR